MAIRTFYNVRIGGHLKDFEFVFADFTFVFKEWHWRFPKMTADLFLLNNIDRQILFALLYNVTKKPIIQDNFFDNCEIRNRTQSAFGKFLPHAD